MTATLVKNKNKKLQGKISIDGYSICGRIYSNKKYMHNNLKDNEIRHIFSFLHFTTLTKIKRVCSDWKRLSDETIENKYNKSEKQAFTDEKELRKMVLYYYKLKYDESNVPRNIFLEEGRDRYEEAEGLPSIHGLNFLATCEEIVVKFGWPINKWDVSQVRDFGGIFDRLYCFDEPIGSWNVSNATSMSYMFHKAQLFNQDISSWDTSHVEDMSYMFKDAVWFNQDISSWNVSNVNCMDDMFSGAANFSQDLRSWDISSVEELSTDFISGANSFDSRLLPHFDERQLS